MTAAPDSSPRRRALREHGLLNPAAAAVREERFRDGDFFAPQDLVQVRYEMLRSVRTGEHTASAAAASFGVSRATYYQVHAAFEREGVAGLLPAKRGPRGAHKLTPEVLDFAVQRLQDDPRLNSSALAELIAARFQLSVHARSIGRALARRKKDRGLHLHDQRPSPARQGVARRVVRTAARTSDRDDVSRPQRRSTDLLPAWPRRLAH